MYGNPQPPREYHNYYPLPINCSYRKKESLNPHVWGGVSSARGKFFSMRRESSSADRTWELMRSVVDWRHRSLKASAIYFAYGFFASRFVISPRSRSMTEALSVFARIRLATVLGLSPPQLAP